MSNPSKSQTPSPSQVVLDPAIFFAGIAAINKRLECIERNVEGLTTGSGTHYTDQEQDLLKEALKNFETPPDDPIRERVEFIQRQSQRQERIKKKQRDQRKKKIAHFKSYLSPKNALRLLMPLAFFYSFIMQIEYYNVLIAAIQISLGVITLSPAYSLSREQYVKKLSDNQIFDLNIFESILRLSSCCGILFFCINGFYTLFNLT